MVGAARTFSLKGCQRRRVGSEFRHRAGEMVGSVMSGGLRGASSGLVARKKNWSERQDSNLRRLAPKASALARLSYAPTTAPECPRKAFIRQAKLLDAAP